MQYFEGEEADNDLTHQGAFPPSGCTQPLLMLVGDEHAIGWRAGPVEPGR